MHGSFGRKSPAQDDTGKGELEEWLTPRFSMMLCTRCRGSYEAPLFGAYSKKVGMWLFLASDSLTFGALLFAFSYNRIYTDVADAVSRGRASPMRPS